MSSLIQDVFNFSPVNSGNIVNGSYTVPSGKYSRVIVTLYARAQASTGISNEVSIRGKNNSLSVDYWLNSGEVVTIFQNTQIINPVGVAQGVMNLLSYTALSTVSINGVVVARCPSNVTFAYTGSFIDIPFVYLDAEVNYRYEEYNNN